MCFRFDVLSTLQARVRIGSIMNTISYVAKGAGVIIKVGVPPITALALGWRFINFTIMYYFSYG